MASLVDDVKDRLDIADVVAGYVKLSPAGANMRGLCPFHREKTPSFMVSREKQIFHCFGCGKGGDVITFIEEMEGMEFKEALRLLAERAGLDYHKYQGGMENKAKSDSKEILRRILEASTVFFERSLKSSEGKTCLKYLAERGLNGKSIGEFRLGYAPRSNDKGAPSALFDYLKGLGFSPAAILGSGSVYKKENQEIYVDRFRGRLIFPVGDSLGRIVGFSARLLPGDDSPQGKYINTPGTILYDKGSLLYGFQQAKGAIREIGEIVMLEGNLDVILSHQAGVGQAVATCGTALGNKQLSFLRRYTNKLILAFDADLAGVKATKRAAELAWEQEFDVKAIPIKAGKDVADIALEDPAKWHKMVEKTKSVAGFFFNLAFKDRVLNLDQKKVLADKILKLLAKVPSRVEQSHYLKKLSEQVQVPESLLWEKISPQKNTGFTRIQNESAPISPSKGRRPLLEERLIGLIYSLPSLYFKLAPNVERAVFVNPTSEKIWQEIKSSLEKLPKSKRSSAKTSDIEFSSRALSLTASTYALQVESEMGDDQDENAQNACQEAGKCFSILETEFLLDQRSQLLAEIKQAKFKDKKKFEDLIKRLESITKTISKIKNKEQEV